MTNAEYKKSQLKYLCSIIGSNPSELDDIISHIDEYYHEWKEPKINNKTGELKRYKDGTVKERTIRPSINRLKVIQKAINTKILCKIDLPVNIHGGVKKKNNITNAKAHQGNKFQFSTDLQDFFPSINHKQVYDVFLKLGFSNYCAHWLTKLTTWKGEVPQGTPTSTYLSNLVFLPTDIMLIDFCKKHKITYTRFVDDLMFSAQKDFQEFIPEILLLIKSSGFRMSYRKTKYKGNQVVTGVEIKNNYIDAPKELKQKAKDEVNKTGPRPYTNYITQIRSTNTGVSNQRNA